MDILKDEFDKYIELKNKEVEEILLLKDVNRKMKQNETKKSKADDNEIDKNIIKEDNQEENIDRIDYRTKKTISNILLEKDRKLKASKNYKKQQSELFLSGQLI
jgi:hypothetical protein